MTSAGVWQPMANHGMGTDSRLPYQMCCCCQKYSSYAADTASLKHMMYLAMPFCCMRLPSIPHTGSVATARARRVQCMHMYHLLARITTTTCGPTGCAHGHLTLRSTCRMGRPLLVGGDAEDPAAPRSCTQHGKLSDLCPDHVHVASAEL